MDMHTLCIYVLVYQDWTCIHYVSTYWSTKNGPAQIMYLRIGLSRLDMHILCIYVLVYQEWTCIHYVSTYWSTKNGPAYIMYLCIGLPKLDMHTLCISVFCPIIYIKQITYAHLNAVYSNNRQ